MTLIRHFIATDPNEPIRAALYEFALARNGVFLRAQRRGLRVQFPIMDGPNLRGELTNLDSGIELHYPRVPARLLNTMLALALATCIPKPKEILFHLWFEGEWQLRKPPQSQSFAEVTPLADGPGTSYVKALIEIHSHHNLATSFSPTDNADERGFRIYAVLGRIFNRPQIRVRVGVYGYYYEIPADTIFELPGRIIDMVIDPGDKDTGSTTASSNLGSAV